jgi:acetyl esterase/lipase
MASILDLPPAPHDLREPYGGDAHQFGDLRLPSGRGPFPVAIVIHGGYWRAAYDLEHIGHLCAGLKTRGVATWSLEYRRIGNRGGGWPGTFDDVTAGFDHLAALRGRFPLDLGRMVAMGHSAGGHLALWLGAQKRGELRAVVSLAGLSDLRRAWDLRLSGGVVAELLGGPPDKVPDRYRAASPIERLPLGLPQQLVHGMRDDIVPFEMSRHYVEKAGAEARLVAFEHAGHFELIDPRTAEGNTVQDAVVQLCRLARPNGGR